MPPLAHTLRHSIDRAITNLRDCQLAQFRQQWPFVVVYSDEMFPSRARSQDIWAWLEANCCEDWHPRWDLGAVGFAAEDDAVAFALWASP